MKKGLKIFLFIFLPLIIIVLLIAIFAIRYFSPINRINRAFEVSDFERVVSLYDSLRDNDDISSVDDRLEQIAKNYYNDYLEENIDFEDTNDFFYLYEYKALSGNRKIRRLYNSINAIKDSRDSYNMGLSLMADGDYQGAIEAFLLVIEEDEKYRALADGYSLECKNKIIDEYIDEADSLIAIEEYEKALEVIKIGLDSYADDEKLLEKLNEIGALMYSDLEGKWSALYDFGDLIASELGISEYNIYFPAELVFEFTENTFKIYVNEDSIENALNEMTSDEESMNALYVIAKDYGINKTEADILVKLMYGGSYTRFLLDQYGTDISGALETFTTNLNYFADSKKIYIGEERNSDNYLLYTQKDTTLTLNEYEGNTNPISMIVLPLELGRMYN